MTIYTYWAGNRQPISKSYWTESETPHGLKKGKRMPYIYSILSQNINFEYETHIPLGKNACYWHFIFWRKANDTILSHTHANTDHRNWQYAQYMYLHVCSICLPVHVKLTLTLNPWIRLSVYAILFMNAQCLQKRLHSFFKVYFWHKAYEMIQSCTHTISQTFMSLTLTAQKAMCICTTHNSCVHNIFYITFKFWWFCIGSNGLLITPYSHPIHPHIPQSSQSRLHTWHTFFFSFSKYFYIFLDAYFYENCFSRFFMTQGEWDDTVTFTHRVSHTVPSLTHNGNAIRWMKWFCQTTHMYNVCLTESHPHCCSSQHNGDATILLFFHFLNYFILFWNRCISFLWFSFFFFFFFLMSQDEWDDSIMHTCTHTVLHAHIYPLIHNGNAATYR